MPTHRIDAVVGDVARDEAVRVRFRPGEALDPTELSGEGELRRDGEVWRIAFGGATFALRDSKGIRQLAELLANPGTELDAVGLASLTGAAPGARPDSVAADGERVSRARVNVTRTIHDAVRKIAHHSPAFGLYLRATIRTGRRCAYVPFPAKITEERARS